MKVLEFPELRQAFNYDCGACAFQSVLAYYGMDYREDRLMGMLGTNGEGTDPEAIMVLANGLKFAVRLVEDIDDIKVAIDSEYPVIVALQAYADSFVDPATSYSNDYDDGHYVVAIGYDQQRIVFEDPSSTTRTYLFWQEFEERWHDRRANGDRLNHWGLVVMGTPQFKLGEMKHMP